MLKGNWGFNRIPKYNEEYFIEDGRELDSLCPFSPPDWCECPHYTDGDIVHDFWNRENATIFLNENEDEFKLPDNIRLNPKLFRIYFYSGISTARDIIRNKEFLITNYVPIIVKNFQIDGKQNRFLDLILPEIYKIGRSVILETGGVRVPVPSFVERI